MVHYGLGFRVQGCMGLGLQMFNDLEVYGLGGLGR